MTGCGHDPMSANAGGLKQEKRDGDPHLISNMEREEDEGLRTINEV